MNGVYLACNVSKDAYALLKHLDIKKSNFITVPILFCDLNTPKKRSNHMNTAGVVLEVLLKEM